jgi:hypothetical protein
MDIAAFVRKWSAVEDRAGALVTLGLDVSKSGRLPPETRVFLKDVVGSDLDSEARPPAVRAVLRKLLRRIRAFAEQGLEEKTEGVFLIAGKGVWEPIELAVPMPNFVVVGRKPYLAPLLAAERRHPRAYVVEAGPRGAVVLELHLGERRELARIEGQKPVDDLEKATMPRGGAERDLQQRRANEATRRTLHAAAAEVAARHRKAPGAAVYLAANHEPFEEFRSRLPAELRPLAASIGPREGAAERAAREIARRSEERSRLEERELREARSRGLAVALGPREVLERMTAGEVARIYVDPQDPHPGMVCTGCTGRFPELRGRCPYCGSELRAASLTQELVTHALAHPPLELAFADGRSPWLAELGGMAGLLVVPSVRRPRPAAAPARRR